ncbi:hypothetical protein BO70DRAFT_172968 [Aspergillus heteromorphus CBS 117.55]|uniref:Protein kinase domain-containing protein n=1 Tax=Aspergillus heteromorphus CBS 117.55 TaxID=1448321 RepID=A0A317UXG6_9EURO|nr:uncharacterized protein BO70DRAFT_172968 [Aspergillus heteromorphus CBS 117.55]PWY66435.1 hypothetical protein BO70DRAFT_172968 [Aspergillus heteromorphus CBS 117.55]
MQDDIAELRRQLEEARHAQQEAERRREEERTAREEERTAREEAERRLQSNTLFHLLNHCHESLSREIRVETDATLTTQGDVTNPVNRLFPKQIVPWLGFPDLQQQIWEKIEHAVDFTSRPLFPSDTQLDYVATNIRNRPIYSEASLRNFERDTVDNFVEHIIEALRGDDILRQEFGIEGRVAFYDRTDSTSLDQPTSSNRGRGGRKGKGKQMAQSQKSNRLGRRRNRRADQFCVHVIADEHRTPLYAVEFKAPHKLTVAELVAGLHEIDLARDVIDQEGDTFEFHATHLIAAVGTQIFSYMHDLGIPYGCIRTGEAFVFLHIPADPTVLQYYLCVPNEDVRASDKSRIHRTAVGQMLAFTLQALAAKAPPQEWHDTADEQLSTWKVEYLDVLRHIPETIRKEPPPSNYRPSRWKPLPKTHNTRSRARCNPGVSTPEASPSESSDSDEELRSPSTAPAARRSSRKKGSERQLTDTREQGSHDQKNKEALSQNNMQRPYCTMNCIRGMATRGPLDNKCPNRQHHGGQQHLMDLSEFTRKLHRQLIQNRNEGFEPLHIRGRTGYLLKATLLSHGYTVVIKATTKKREYALKAEVDNYHHLQSLQGDQIPICLGDFKPNIKYWYHGEPMTYMMILSWSGTRLQRIINNENSAFFHEERNKCLSILRSHGVVHKDKEWRNMLWDEFTRRLVVIDLEDVEWLERPKRPRSLQPKPGNLCHGARARNKRRRLSSLPATCTT